MLVNDGWSQERSSWRKEKLELVSAVALAVDQSYVILSYIIVYVAALMVVILSVQFIYLRSFAITDSLEQDHIHTKISFQL